MPRQSLILRIYFSLILGLFLPCLIFAQNWEVDTNRIIRTGSQGDLTIHQDGELDALQYRYKEVQKQRKGMPGYRIQIYFGSGRTSRLDAYEAKAKFISDFPDIPAYVVYQSPFYKVRVGDFRTKREAHFILKKLNREFPSAYLTPLETINLPPLESKSRGIE